MTCHVLRLFGHERHHARSISLDPLLQQFHFLCCLVGRSLDGGVRCLGEVMKVEGKDPRDEADG